MDASCNGNIREQVAQELADKDEEEKREEYVAAAEQRRLALQKRIQDLKAQKESHSDENVAIAEVKDCSATASGSRATHGGTLASFERFQPESA